MTYQDIKRELTLASDMIEKGRLGDAFTKIVGLRMHGLSVADLDANILPRHKAALREYASLLPGKVR